MWFLLELAKQTNPDNILEAGSLYYVGSGKFDCGVVFI